MSEWLPGSSGSFVIFPESVLPHLPRPKTPSAFAAGLMFFLLKGVSKVAGVGQKWLALLVSLMARVFIEKTSEKLGKVCGLWTN